MTRLRWTLAGAFEGRSAVRAHQPDPYCIWAELNQWLGYIRPSLKKPAWVIIELTDVAAFQPFIQSCNGRHIVVPRAYRAQTPSRQSKFLTACVTYDGLCDLADATPGGPGSFVRRFDLSDYVQPGRAPATDEAIKSRAVCQSKLPKLPLPATPRPPIEATQLIGIIDDGCVFAHPSFVTARGSTRVAALWDQDAAPAFKDAVDNLSPGRPLGGRPYGFVGGREIWRGERPDGSLGLDHWLRRCGSPTTGGIDEVECYEDAGYGAMRPRITHGSHVMDVLVGPISNADRRFGDRDTPPSWRPATDAAADAARSDIVFVQLPQAGLQDRSGGWLDSHVLDAVRYILGCRNAETRKTVITLSYGSTVGPHDGSSILASALDQLKCIHGSGLDLVIAAGNSFDTRGHAQVDMHSGTGSLRWRVLPGSESPSFLQVWMPPGSQVALRMAPPGGDLADMMWVPVDESAILSDRLGPAATIVNRSESSRGAGAMALVVVGATEESIDKRGLDEASMAIEVAPHGEWRLEFRSATPLDQPLDVYIARNDRGLSSPRRGEQSYVVDPIDEQDRFLRSPVDDGDVANADDLRLFGEGRRGAQIRRRGTINGTASRTSVVVAGYRSNFSTERSEGTHAPYSSAGKSDEAGMVTPRGMRPTTSVPTDESAVLPGLRASGTRGGCTFRMVGTSVGAPAHARSRLLSVGRGPMPAISDPDLDGDR